MIEPQRSLDLRTLRRGDKLIVGLAGVDHPHMPSQLDLKILRPARTSLRFHAAFDRKATLVAEIPGKQWLNACPKERVTVLVGGSVETGEGLAPRDVTRGRLVFGQQVFLYRPDNGRNVLIAGTIYMILINPPQRYEARP